MDAGHFLRRYWQRRPLLLRQAVPRAALAIDARRLFELAARDDVESRLVTAFDGRWRLRHGPLPARALPPRGRARWTLLVQGVDTVDPTVEALMAAFRFLPDARLDDAMVSYASDRGGVGPHVDSYDVFLIQVAGRRRWRIERGPRAARAALRPGLPLRILARFAPTDSWLLGPGDMLYLPPGVAHEGVALGESITCSIGARAPAWQDLVEPWHALLADSTRIAGRYRDRQVAPTSHPARLPADLATLALARLAAHRPSRADAERMLLGHLSEPKRHVVFERPARPLSPSRFAAAAARRGLRCDPRTRMLYAGSQIAINGELVRMPPAAASGLRRFADWRALPPASLPAIAAAIGPLRIWYLAGWIHLGGS